MAPLGEFNDGAALLIIIPKSDLVRLTPTVSLPALTVGAPGRFGTAATSTYTNTYAVIDRLGRVFEDQSYLVDFKDLALAPGSSLDELVLSYAGLTLRSSNGIVSWVGATLAAGQVNTVAAVQTTAGSSTQIDLTTAAGRVTYGQMVTVRYEGDNSALSIENGLGLSVTQMNAINEIVSGKRNIIPLPPGQGTGLGAGVGIILRFN